jgi:nucleoside-diphosphate-sugar epimerase
MHNSNILITGAFGFVGTNLFKPLKTVFQCNLIALDVKEPDKNKYDVFHSWNDLDKIDWSKIDTIIHLAGKAHDTKNTTEESAYFEINVGLTQKIFEYFLKSNASKFIFFSSVKAVADNVSGEFLTEETLPNPQTAYGKSKLAAEKYVLNQASDFQLPASNKKVYILRPSMIHGPGNKGNLNLLYKLVQKGIPWPLGAFKNNRSFTSIGNLAFIIQQIIQKDIEPGIYQIADDEPLSTNRLIELISESRNKKAHIWNINPKIISTLAKLGDNLHLPLNSERLKKLTESYVVSNQKLKNALGIDKMPVSAENGMRHTLESFK